MIDFQEEYDKAFRGEYGNDLREHLPWLTEYANKCKHVTELGVGWGESTRGFLNTDVELHSYEIAPWPVILELFEKVKEAGRNATLHVTNVLEKKIPETDLLLIDTFHTYTQLKAELLLHAPQVRKYIFMHDTTLNGEVGTDGSVPALWLAVTEFLEANPEWKLIERKTNCNGMTLLERI